MILDKQAHADKRRLCYDALSDRALIREILPEDRGPHRRVNNLVLNETSVFAGSDRLQNVCYAWLQFRGVVKLRLFEGNVIAAKTAIQRGAFAALSLLAFAGDDVRNEFEALPNIGERHRITPHSKVDLGPRSGSHVRVAIQRDFRCPERPSSEWRIVRSQFAPSYLLPQLAIRQIRGVAESRPEDRRSAFDMNLPS